MGCNLRRKKDIDSPLSSLRIYFRTFDLSFLHSDFLEEDNTSCLYLQWMSWRGIAGNMKLLDSGVMSNIESSFGATVTMKHGCFWTPAKQMDSVVLKLRYHKMQVEQLECSVHCTWTNMVHHKLSIPTNISKSLVISSWPSLRVRFPQIHHSLFRRWERTHGISHLVMTSSYDVHAPLSRRNIFLDTLTYCIDNPPQMCIMQRGSRKKRRESRWTELADVAGPLSIFPQSIFHTGH